MIDPCPSDDLLALHVDGRLSPGERSTVTSHLRECDDCRRLVGALAAARTRTHSTQGSEIFPASTWRWHSGRRVGRYVLEGPLGRGGMGEVYEALDVELHRRVAIKVARPGPADESRSNRVVAEGRTLASLDHPNVVRVFDTGTHDGAAYIVMERARGSSLRRWLASSPRSVRDLLHVFRGVARGCAAIHDAGLVHRDIKPDNILISEDEEGLLSDFGLGVVNPVEGAQSSDQGTNRRPPTSASRRGPSGTPGYIAPEVERGGVATPASDQFGFCVTLAEALRGCERGRTPRWAKDVIARGTHEDPLRRFESMDMLLARLEAPRSWAQSVVLATGTIATVAAITALARPSDTTTTCSWKDGSWSHTEVDDATWRRFRQDWTHAAQLACDTHADAATQTCLQQQRSDAIVLLEAIRGAQTPASPLTALDPQSCLESPNADNAMAVAHTRETITLATAARLEGRVDDARAFVAKASALAAATSDPASIVSALYESGLVTVALGQYDAAAEKFESAHWMALRVDEPGIAADSAIELLDLLTNGNHFEEARRWRLHATAALERTAEPDPMRWSQLELVTSLMHQRMHEFPEAVASAQRARDHAQQLDPTPQWVRISVESRIGGAMQVAGNAEGARAHLERALQWQLELRGEDHPATANILLSLGTLHMTNLFEDDLGASMMKRAIAILDKPGAVPTFTAAKAHEALAYTYMGQQRYEDARPAIERTVELHDLLFPPEHPRRLATYMLRANLAQADGKPEEAWRLAEEGVLVANRTLGGSAPLTASMSAMAGELAVNQEKFDIAEQRLETALVVFEEVSGPEHPVIVDVLSSLGNAKSGLGKSAEAAECFERALKIAAGGPAAARPLLGLARLSDEPEDTIRYVELARAADPSTESEAAEILNRIRR
ncbi:MAG: protein kinase domain-containing protein [Nannocystales bacterium]